MNLFNEFLRGKSARKLDYNEARTYVKKGGDLGRFSVDEVRQLQDKALNARDNEFFDSLERYWKEIRWQCR